MALFKKIYPDENSILAIWKIDERKEDLVNLIDERLHEISKPKNVHDNVGKHWLASRALLLQLFDKHKVEVHKDLNNKPSLVVDGKRYFIAITHSYDYAAVMISDRHEVGLDMERIDKRIGRVAHKFINDDELLYVSKVKEDDLILYQTIIWSAKETIYKIYGRKELDFKEHMSVCAFQLKQDTFSGRIHKLKEQHTL
ncbi:MAG: 4'-phosphopantetheinyl transferase superfamily protein, partial [Bacteroidetes bacterium]|nr:4'-phosphopantetheinyl transferase superfamily protein [Bacteroidota bacterium]